MVDIFGLESFGPVDHHHREHWLDKRIVDKGCRSKWLIKPDPGVLTSDTIAQGFLGLETHS